MLINAQHCLKGPKLNDIQCTGIFQEVHAKMYVSKNYSIVLSQGETDTTSR